MGRFADKEGMRFAVSCLSLFVLWVALSVPGALGAPKDTENYHRIQGGLVDIPDGSYVEGSHRFGGIQPDYHVDASHPEIKRLLAYARKAKREEPDFWKRVQRIVTYIQKWQLPNRKYEDPGYLALNKKTLQAGSDVSLGEYAACRAGVCRENALYLHLALKEAGVPNYHAYAQIKRASRYYDYELVEDHAFVVAEHEGKQWVVDSYYRGFNGYLLKDLMSRKGITPESEMSPIARAFVGQRKVLRINEFPAIWAPKAAEVHTLPTPRPLLSRWSKPCEYYYDYFSGRF
jgi:hypothetical protein